MVHVLQSRGHLFIEQVRGDDDLAFGHVQVVDDLVLGGQGVHHVGYGADAVHGVEAVESLGDVGEAYGHRVPGANAEGPERPGGTLDAADEPGVGGLFVIKLVGGLVGILLRHPVHQLEHGGVGVGEMLSGSVGGFHPSFLQIFDIPSIP